MLRRFSEIVGEALFVSATITRDFLLARFLSERNTEHSLCRGDEIMCRVSGHQATLTAERDELKPPQPTEKYRLTNKRRASVGVLPLQNGKAAQVAAMEAHLSRIMVWHHIMSCVMWLIAVQESLT